MEREVQRENPERRSMGRSVLAALPTAAVLASLVLIGVWGHRTGWRAPRFAELFGAGVDAQAEDWCTEHNVPDSKCIACHPELVGADPADWCREHGVPESRCTVCHPELLQSGVAGDWCEEHGVPESGCTLCHPEIAHPGRLPAQDRAALVSGGSHEEELPEDHPAGDPARAGPLRDPRTCQKHALRVQFASAASVEKAGIELGQVVERPMSASVLVSAEVDYDRTRLARLSSRVAGIAWRVERELGAAVQAGEILTFVDSAEVGRAKAEFLAASAGLEARSRTRQRLERSAEAGFRTASERAEAEAAAREAEVRLFNARQALANLGLPVPEDGADEDKITRLGLPESVSAASANLLPLVAPFEGVVVAREVVAGEWVDSARTLFEIADTRRLWVAMDVPQAEAHRIVLGQEILYRPDDARDEVVAGSVTWISTAVDEMTRTVKVRGEIENPRGALRAHSFGRAQIVVRASPDAVAVPNEAIQWEGCCYVVFVRLSDELFQARKVRLGAKDAAYIEVLVGALPGEIVATTGSHVLKSEILKSQLGAGCTDE